MSASNEQLFLYQVQGENSPTEFATVETAGLDVFFPEGVFGWSDVLDCRPEPYKDMSLEENGAFAYHVAKKYILVAASQVDNGSGDHDS